MTTPSPTMETVITAIKAAMDAISPTVGTTYTGWHTLEDDVEAIIKKGLLGSSIDMWMIEGEQGDSQEGDAAGEIFEFYRITITHWCLRTADDDWSKTARQKAEAVRDALVGASSVFAISGQRQLQAPETVQIMSHGPKKIGEDSEAGGQMVYETVLGLTVEARRWAS